MIRTISLYTTNNMSVEGPYTSYTFAHRETSRSNVHSEAFENTGEVTFGTYQQDSQSRRGTVTAPQGTIMPVSTSSQSLLASLPSFMSVFGNGPDRLAVNEANSSGSQSPSRAHTKRPQNFTSPFTRRDSVSTFESTESSPTTTISTVESSLTEPSPQSPPESPDSSLPLTSFKNLRTQSVPGWGVMGDQERRDHFTNTVPILSGGERADSPNKKMRNMKNLSVNTLASNRHAPTLPKLGLSHQSNAPHAFSAPPTPAFIVPPKVPRKKPSTLGLTITTPEDISIGQTAQARPSALPQSSSDCQTQTLHALQMSTSGPLFSPTVAPKGGMRLPPFSHQASSDRLGKIRPSLSVSPQTSSDDIGSSPITRQTLDHVQEETDYELPLSQEVKSPAYPQGPVCIYDPNVYLYLEPSQIEARQFDVVLNVAREVKNPFSIVTEKAGVAQTQSLDAPPAPVDWTCGFAGRNSTSESQAAPAEQSMESAPDGRPGNGRSSAPSTPKATRPEPEYVHVPWDHNTNVVDDLLRLCELIDDRVQQEKRVLIHCQCGVSRSASLVVAYGLFKNPQLTVQEAYDAVKNRSRWIGPNMNLIYQLSEFKNKLPKAHTTGTSAWHLWRNNLGSGRPDFALSSSPGPKPDLGASSIRTTPKTSFSVHSQLTREINISRTNSFSPPASAQFLDRAKMQELSPGPSSAPPDMQFAPKIPVVNKMAASVITATDELSPSDLMDVDSEITLQSSSFRNDAIQQKEKAPVGGVTKDLQNVAKDLDATVHDPVPLSPPRNMAVDQEAFSFPKVFSPMTMSIDLDEPVSPTTVVPMQSGVNTPAPRNPTPSPILPAGFSSLLSRRQGPPALRQLPSKESSPMLVSTNQRAFDPDVPPTPSLLSPRAAEFRASPFHRTAAGDLAGSSVFEQGMMSPKVQDEDPRSPARKGEAPITRSIFDFL